MMELVMTTKLTAQGRQRARSLIHEYARPLEQRLYAWHFEGGSAPRVWRELAWFQNPDGGFGHGLEPDFRHPKSSVLATTRALQIMRELRAEPRHPLVRGAMKYLVHTFDTECGAWPLIPAHDNTHPHAPWWRHDVSREQNREGWRANPGAEVLGYLYDYADLAPAELLERAEAAAFAHLDRPANELDMHDLLCYVRLAESETLPATRRARLHEWLGRAAGQVVARDPAQWGEYCLRPLDLAHHPTSPLTELLADAVSQHLAYETEQIETHGLCPVHFHWDEAFPEAARLAQREWQGILTLDTLKRLRDFGCLEA